MTLTLTIVVIGLGLVVIVHGLAMCVLYLRVTKLTRLVALGSGARSLLGFEIPHFQAINARSGETVTYKKNETIRLCLLIVSSDCLLCQQLLYGLRDQKVQILEDSENLEFIVYCQGSLRGASSLLSRMDSRMVTLVAHDTDLTTVLPLKSVPALLSTDSTGRVVRHTYPFTVEDIFSVLASPEMDEQAVALD
ncbi:MAG: hypothetical protein F4Z01_07910 [Gammaproteobacteria bacterium]|nr:hypothetical protein [Gammaproteobacteria bacterium]MYF38656.1 hypothetical protein [Gammaproteobacteria bacterium]